VSQALVEFVLKETTRPLDRWAVAATLESAGIRDVDATVRYGKRDVFDLADDVLARCLELPPPARVLADDEAEPRWETCKRFLRGGFFFVQLALQLGSLVLIGYGQWASLSFSERQASLVAIALLASFFVTGPVSQAIGRVGSHFGEPGKHVLAARTVAASVVLGLAALLLGAAAWWAVNLVFGGYDDRTLGAALAYYGLAGCLSLCSAVLYMLKQFAAMVIATLAGIASVGVMLHQVGTGIYAAHWTGLTVGIVTEAAWAFVVFRRRVAITTPESRLAVLPPRGMLLELVAPFALYGAGYFALLFVDRLAAWSTDAHGLPFTFRASYEVGLDWALISVVPGLAFLEVTVYAFSSRLGELGDRYDAGAADEHNRALRRFYREQLLRVTVLLAGGIAATVALFWVASSTHATKISGLIGDTTTVRVYALGAVGYALLVYGVFSSSFVFAVGRPWSVLATLVPSIAVAAAVAFTLSRLLVYWAAVGGLVAGTATFAILSALTACRGSWAKRRSSDAEKRPRAERQGPGAVRGAAQGRREQGEGGADRERSSRRRPLRGRPARREIRALRGLDEGGARGAGPRDRDRGSLQAVEGRPDRGAQEPLSRRNTYCRIPPWRRYSRSRGVSRRTRARNCLSSARTVTSCASPFSMPVIE
jgi:hypothetical protein